MHVVRYRRYPNNEIRAVHYYSIPARNDKDVLPCEEVPDCTPSEAIRSDDEGEKTPPSSLTLEEISLSPGLPLPFKKTKFGRNAKNTLLRIGGAYDTLSAEPSDFVFLTGTLPGNTPAAFRVIAEYSSYIAKSIAMWLGRRVKSEHYFYVWELQKRGALHFHYCIYTPDDRARQYVLREFKSKWTSLLDDISTRSGTCLWEGDSGTCWTDRYGTLQAYAQTVHTSVAAYLSGYLGGSRDKHASDESSPYYPRRWWGASRASTTLLKALTEEVIFEHTNYRAANHRILSHYEQVLHDSPKAHKYSHKVGIGSTVVSYHPEDKGVTIWESLTKMSLHHQHHPHIASLIRQCHRAFVMSRHYMKPSSNSKNSAPEPLFLSLQDSSLVGSLQRLTLQDTHLSILKEVKCKLLLPSLADHHLNACIQTLLWIEEFLTLNQGHLRFNQYGWLCNPDDLPYTVDIKRSFWQSSTTDSDERMATEGAAHGSLSPQNPLSSQTELWHSSD